MNKKASMQLGINAIVILIIALAILGLAMTFITSLFKGGQIKLGSIIERTDLPVHADPTNPIMFDNSQITIKQGGTGKVVMSVYNSNFGNQEEVALEMTNCVSSDPDATGSIDIGLSSPAQKIPMGMDAGYMAIIRVGDVPKGSYICVVEAANDEATVSQQLFIDVVV